MSLEIFSYRPESSNKKAVIFIHGFSGHYIKTWEKFPWILASDLACKDWDFWSLGYPTSRNIDWVGWTREPTLVELSNYLGGIIQQEPLARYEEISLVCHSMGGLITRRMIIDIDEIKEKVTSLTMFGTPNKGLKKASFFQKIKAQAGDMVPDNEFITSLNKDWNLKFSNGAPRFDVICAGGLSDDFVPTEVSVIDNIPNRFVHIIGDHRSIVKPESHDCESVNLVKKMLLKSLKMADPGNVIQFAAYAVNDDVFEKRMAQINKADPDFKQKVVDLGLALERSGRPDQARDFLEKWIYDGTDIQGTYAGRWKRRWLMQCKPADAELAFHHYSEALERALAAGDHDQIYYLAINVAFMHFLMREPDLETSQEQAKKYAKLAHDSARESKTNFWNMATLAESYLYFEELDNALQCYDLALKQGPVDERTLTSTGQQAYEIAEEFERRGKPLQGFKDLLLKHFSEYISVRDKAGTA